MPAIVARGDQSAWLDPASQDLARLKTLLGPYPAKEMEAYRVSKAVSDAKNEGAELSPPSKRNEASPKHAFCNALPLRPRAWNAPVELRPCRRHGHACAQDSRLHARGGEQALSVTAVATRRRLHKWARTRTPVLPQPRRGSSLSCDVVLMRP